MLPNVLLMWSFALTHVIFMWMHALLLLLPDKELAVMVSDSISMAVLLMVDTLRPLRFNSLELTEKKGGELKKEPPA